MLESVTNMLSPLVTAYDEERALVLVTLCNNCK